MAAGTPDYTKQIREQFGSGTHMTGQLMVTPSDLTELVTITGKGVIYGGLIYLDHLSTQKDSKPIILIDGATIISFSYWEMLKLGLFDTKMYPMSISTYDEDDFAYTACLANGIKFEKEIMLAYSEMSGATPTVYWSLIYALL